MINPNTYINQITNEIDQCDQSEQQKISDLLKDMGQHLHMKTLYFQFDEPTAEEESIFNAEVKKLAAYRKLHQDKL